MREWRRLPAIVLVVALAGASAAAFLWVTPVASGLVARGSITIQGNADFTAANGVVGGSGTPDDPYVIQGWEIRGSISVADTDAHFVIRNVMVYSGDWYGIRFERVRDGQVEDASVSVPTTVSTSGVLIVTPERVVVRRVVVRGGQTGIYDYGGSNLDIFDSDVSGSTGLAMSISQTSDVSLVGNRVDQTGGGIALDANRATIDSNEITRTYDGLMLGYSSNLTVVRNLIANNTGHGIYVLGLRDVIFRGNTIYRNGQYGAWLRGSRIVFSENVVRFNTIFLGNGFGPSSDIIVSRNRILDALATGLRGEGTRRMTMTGNTIEGSGFSAINLTSLRDSLAYQNNFIGHGPDHPLAFVTGTNNRWENGYPDGGNFWSDYVGVDLCSGPNQDICTGPDGMGDTPFSLSSGNVDRYPYLARVPPANRPPTVSALSASPSSLIVMEEAGLSAQLADSDGDPFTYVWDFGDGTTSAGASEIFPGVATGRHAFEALGTYAVTLTVDDGHGGVSTASTSVVVSEPALLRVTTEIDLHPEAGVPGKILVDGVPRDEWGLNWVKMAPGRHTIAFTDVWNLGTPEPVTVDLQSGQVTNVPGVYKSYGWLRVITDPPLAATILVNGVRRDNWGMWMAVPPGTYTVSFDRLSSYTPPAPQTVEVEAEALTVVVGRYVFDGVSPGPTCACGLLRVETVLSDGRLGAPTQILVDGVARDEWGLNWLWIEEGTHLVEFTDVWTLGTPPARRVNVFRWDTTLVTATFDVLGNLRVTTDPPVPGTIYVDGVPRDDWGMWQSMPQGIYTVSFGPVPGYDAPPAQTVAILAGQPTLVVGKYLVAASGSREGPSFASAGTAS